MTAISDVLTSLGYEISESSSEYRAAPIYRGSNNKTSLRIDKTTGYFIDFGANIRGSLEELVKLTLNFESIEAAQEFLKKQNFDIQTVKKPTELKSRKIFPIELLKELKDDTIYWENRGISKNILAQFRGGVAGKGKMKDRFVFPIFDSNNNIIGFSGRILKDSSIKWKHLGNKTEWAFPLFLNKNSIDEKKCVILVESIGDVLALFECGIYHVICIFGLDLSKFLLSLLIKLDPKKIIVALNNELDNDSIGNRSSEKIAKRLTEYFDRDSIEVRLPPSKDINDFLLEKGKEKVIELYGKV